MKREGILLILVFISICSCNVSFKSNVTRAEFLNYVRNGNLEKVKSSIESGYDVNTLDAYGGNALKEAVFKEKDGKTALHICCIAGNVELKTLKLLLESGADPSIKDANEKVALDYAIRYSLSKEEWSKSFKEKADLLKSYVKE